MKKLIIFDLDGTLLNTIADLAQSVNYALSKLGFPTHKESAYNFMVGNGINKLFERALPEHRRSKENIIRMRQEFLSYYGKHNMDKTRPYPGISKLLQTLQQRGTMLAVASNKYHEGTKKLIDFYFPEINFAAVYGQRERILPKPDPTVVFDIMNDTGIPKEEILYVGDSGVDMQTAKNAGVTACGVTWGFRPIEELQMFNPEYIVDTAEEILSIE
ncbi:HAD family hydrolase [Bacteroides sp. 519]|uniref:HAD family hydrolase n=1 Tax=Bacteroides sp. 519 TaxID=2302937 RepID=UPI0013D33348|nr:HAD family hydrolase [Bacteroides sp. 519]NDV58932.1 HAD family hydrolase [Bacteroides sp. 519]